MVIATKAAVRALWAQDDHPSDNGWWIWRLQLEIPQKVVKSSPVLVKNLITAFLAVEPGAQVRSAKNHTAIDMTRFPTNTFADTFVAKSKQQNLLLHFELLSKRSFYKIKTTPDAWSILKTYRLFLRKTPGGNLASAHPTKTLGFWVGINPRSICPGAFAKEIRLSLKSEYDNFRSNNTGLPPQFPDLTLLCTSSIISAVDKGKTVKSEALLQQADHTDPKNSALALLCLKTWMESSPLPSEEPIFIPLRYKYTNPQLWLAMVRKQREFLNTHTQIAIMGASPTHLDFPVRHFPSLQAALQSNPAIKRIDPCRTTPQDGRWNLTTSSANLPGTKQFIDSILDEIHQSDSTFPEFPSWPLPVRLDRKLASDASSVYSDLSGDDSDPLAISLQKLALPPPTNPGNETTLPLKHSWNKPPKLQVENIQFIDDLTSFPPLPTPQVTDDKAAKKKTRFSVDTTTASTQSGDVSGVTEPKSQTSGASRAIAHFKQRLDDMDRGHQADLHQLHEKINSIQDNISNAITTTMLAPDGPLEYQRRILDEKISSLEKMILSLGHQIQTVLTHTFQGSKHSRESSGDTPTKSKRRNYTPDPMLDSPTVIASPPELRELFPVPRTSSPPSPLTPPPEPYDPAPHLCNKGKQE